MLVYHIIAQFLHSLDQLAILLHNVVVVLSVQRRHLLQLVIEFLIGIGQELSLCLKLLLDVLVYILLLLLLILHVVEQVLFEAQLQLLVVIDVLGDPVHCIAVGANVGHISADLVCGILIGLLHLLLPRTIVING